MNTFIRYYVVCMLELMIVMDVAIHSVHGWVSNSLDTTIHQSVRARHISSHNNNNNNMIKMMSSTSNNMNDDKNDYDMKETDDKPDSRTRRQVMKYCSALAVTIMPVSSTMGVQPSNAAVGSLPEYADTNAVLQGLTVNVADASQQESMIKFLVDSFDFKVLRKRIRGSVEETWLGYGPEQLSIPKEFELPVSSFGTYGGHASVCLKYDSTTQRPLYRGGEDAPGDSIAYLQVGVPGYRISQMVANGGKILDAYGLVNVLSPCGLPMRGIVGISPDPIMFVAINCKDVQESKSFYQQLGFEETEVPYSRPSKGTTLFEPAPPKGSAYMSPSPNCMGVLLLPTKNKKKVTPTPVLDSLNIVYAPSSSSSDSDDGSSSSSNMMIVQDPSGVPVKFQSVTDFTTEEKITR